MEFISIVIFIFVIFTVIKNKKKLTNGESSGAGSKTRTSPAKPVASAVSVNKTAGKKPVTQTAAVQAAPKPPIKSSAGGSNLSGAGHTHSFKNSGTVSTFLEDRNNDWLANQLREEHRAFKKTSEMFDLKIEHVSHCDAKILKQTHYHQ